MSTDPLTDRYILSGPTGSGKTALGLALAEQLGAEIVSMDSMTLYRGMDIGTAKPTQEERRRVPHHLIDVLDPWESASVAWWLEQARRCCDDIRSRGKRLLFVGGTALYLKALLFGLFDGPPADAELRQRLTEEADRLGGAVLHARLAAVDPVAAGRLHPNDVRRVVRALEVWQLTGRPISDWQQQWRQGDKETRRLGDKETGRQGTEGSSSVSLSPCLPVSLSPCVWLDVPREELYARINVRVERMVAAGLVEEVQALRRLPRPPGREASQALGYKETFEHLDGRATLEETVELIQTRSRNYAKRQLTWFRHLPGCRPASRELTFALWGLTMK